MKVLFPVLLVLAACSGSEAPSSKAAASPGELLFKQRCALCHATDTKNGQGPGLAGVVGRPAASAPGFQYTKALRESGLTWDEATLDRFLASPFTMVRGTLMSVSIPDANERKEIITYLSSLGK